MTGFVKIYGSKLLSSSLWDAPPEARLVFVGMLALADAEGVVDVPNVRALARVLNLDVKYVERGLAVLEAPDEGSRTPDEEGRRVIRDGSRWRMVNYAKYREYRTKQQEDARRRVEAFRARRSVTSNACNALKRDITLEAEAEAEKKKDMSGSGSQTTMDLVSSEPERQRRSDDVLAVFAHYREQHPRAFRNPNRDSDEWRKIGKRLAEGSTVEDLKRAIDGYHASPWHQGNNDRKTKYLDLSLIVRDGSHVAKGIELADQHLSGTGGNGVSAEFAKREAESIARIAARYDGQ